MDFITIISISIGLALDAFAISIANGVIIKRHKRQNALKFGLSFGLFQMLMPLIGWRSGKSLYRFIASFDHWAVFGILIFIGGKMIYESTRIDSYEESKNEISLWALMGLSIATSMDALAVGLSFAFLKISVVLPAIVIGIVTFMMAYFGFLIGNKFGHIFEKKIEIAGGLILIAIGIKILIQHLLG